ncbi:recombinase family protein [Proteiniclasticum ruminis]|uniref:Site-specific DNA recombinase n=1 Tax=Proteiniclasticum ruminis TaxID=398199 RepID=A0A1G8I5V4_9CLOT|nr:recombinase family protein [Proteiniclasticum ruminis]SDI14131.1 Site-specific DNA recombinase [Proteiniclasticum ruminis]
MSKSFTIAYARTSSTSQKLDRELSLLSSNGYDRIFVDQKSGKDMNREGYNSAKAMLRPGDTFVVTALDRISRNFRELKKEYQYLIENKINVVVLNMKFMKTGNNLTDEFLNGILIELLAYIAETERNFIKERQKQGIAAAKGKGKKFGRPEIKIDTTKQVYLQDWFDGKITATECHTRLGISRTTLYKIRKKYTAIKRKTDN